MRIKRFHAPDMRTALRMVRDEQGPDAVILSNRATADGIEVVAATDYDESLMSQALRAAAPGIDTSPTPGARAQQNAVTANVPASVPASNTANVPPTAPAAAPAAPAAPSFERVLETATHTAPPATARSTAEIAAAQIMAARAAAKPVAVATTTASETPAAAGREMPRESLISRARAIFRIGEGAAEEGPTLAELTASVAAARAAATPAPTNTFDIRVDDSLEPDVDEATAPASIDTRSNAAIVDTSTLQNVTDAPNHPDEATFESLIAGYQAPAAPAPIQAAPGQPPVTAGGPAPATSPYAQASDADYLIALSSPGALAVAAVPVVETTPRPLHAVPAPRIETPDPSFLAMREELASMRALMEKQMEQLSLERLRGSPARAAVLDALLGYGCDDALAQSIASAVDPRLAGDELQAAMATQFAQALPVLRHEPIEDGGVIALVGPTGAGKTTTAAKLAARFAARHRARDVALVSIDRERTGAREQLHAYGRRLGVTVCDAESADELGQALDQLVDYPLVLVDTTGYGVRDRALLRQILWLRSSSRLRSLLVLPANANPHDLGEIARRYRPAAPQGVVLTKLDETGRAGAALSVLAGQGLPLAYTSAGQQIPHDLQAADATALAPVLASLLEKTTRAAVNPLAIEDRHAFA